MKKTTYLKTLLVAVCLLGGASFAWADDVPTPTYFNDFESYSTDLESGNLTIKGTGRFENSGDARFGYIYHNAYNGSAIVNNVRTNYLKLPSNILSESGAATSKKLSIGFWVNVKNAENFWFSPIFTAYQNEPSETNTNTWPMFALETRGLLYSNNYGIFNSGDVDNEAGTNTANTFWLDDNDWHYYTCVIDGTTAKIYIDGEIFNSFTPTDEADHNISHICNNLNNLTYVCLGGNQAWNWDDNDPAFGFDDIAVYKEALTQAQIKQIIGKKKPIISFPASYNLSSWNTTNKWPRSNVAPFDAGSIYHGGNVTALMVPNTTATAYFDSNTSTVGNQPYELGTDETVTVAFTAYHGNVPSGSPTSTVQLLNSKNKILVSYTYNIKTGNVTDVKLGNTTYTGFSAFKGRSSYSGSSDANGIGSNSYAIQTTEGYNPQVEMGVSANGDVSFKFSMTAGQNKIYRIFNTHLEKFTMDLASIKIIDNCSTAGRSIAISDLSITSAVTTTSINNAIADCKANETSAAFATYIDEKRSNGDFSNANQVYAAHTAWQVAQAKASGSTDYSKVILNYAVESTDHWGGSLSTESDKSNINYEGATGNYYLYTSDADYNTNQTVYSIPAGKYKFSAWTYNSRDNNNYNYYRKLYVGHIVNDEWTDYAAPYSNANGWDKIEGEFSLSETTDVYFGFYAGGADGTESRMDNWSLTLVGVPVEVGSAGYATYVSTYNLDYTNTTIKAYTAKVNTTTGAIVLSKINKVPANTPVVLYADGGATENIPVAASTDTPADNDLHAGTGAAVATGTNPYNYILNNVSGIGFYKAAGQTVATNRAYLQTTYDVATPGARMVMVFADEETTGIADVRGKMEDGRSGYFDLQGRQVAQPTKGLYIVNGKKVVIK